MEHIRKCSSCGKYTMEKNCSQCSAETALAKPPKFSPDDKYASMRREIKREELMKKGWL